MCVIVDSVSGVGRRTLRAEELSGDVEGLAAHNDDLLAVQQLLGDGRGQTTEKVTCSTPISTLTKPSIVPALVLECAYPSRQPPQQARSWMLLARRRYIEQAECTYVDMVPVLLYC